MPVSKEAIERIAREANDGMFTAQTYRELPEICEEFTYRTEALMQTIPVTSELFRQFIGEGFSLHNHDEDR